MPQVNGLYRLCHGAEIEPCLYDFDTGKIGEVFAKSPYPFLQEHYYTKGAIPLYYMYKFLVERDDVYAVFNCNNTFVMMIKDEGIHAAHWYEDDFRYHECEVIRPKRNLVHIGWTLTKPATPDLDIIPYKLFLDPVTGKVRLHGRWVPVEGPFTINPDLSSYKDLINSEYEAVYVTASNERRFL